MSFSATRSAVPQHHMRTRIDRIVCARAGLASVASEKPAGLQPSEPSLVRSRIQNGTSSARRNQTFATTDGAVHLRVQLDASDRSATVKYRTIESFRNSVTPLGSPFSEPASCGV